MSEEVEEFGNGFYMLNGQLLKVSGNYFDQLRKEKDLVYALEACGDEVFTCRIHDDGDPYIETTATAHADMDLFREFLEEIS